MTKDVSQGQEFFELHYFSCQNGPKYEFYNYRYKTSDRDYFLENKASLMVFSPLDFNIKMHKKMSFSMIS